MQVHRMIRINLRLTRESDAALYTIAFFCCFFDTILSLVFVVVAVVVARV